MNSKQLSSLAIKYAGDWHKIKRAIETNEKIEEMDSIDQYITILDEAYPTSLKALENPPWVLFYQGDISLLKKDCISIVGSREACTYGTNVTRYISEQLARKYVIVSGMAKGIDAISHQGALHVGGKTIGVLGHGLATVYPKENIDLYQEVRNKGLLITEFPHHTKIQKYYFPWRNRIIAALSNKLIVTQATIQSGTMHTVNEALKLAKDIYCVPYPFMDSHGTGCNQLIQEGANMLYDRESLFTLFD